MNTDQQPPPERSARLESLATYLQTMRDEERAHLARELHDELGALLMGAKLDVASLRTQLGANAAAVEARLQHLGDLLSRGIALKSSIVEGLCPSALAHLGVVASLEILAREFESNSCVVVTTDLRAVAIDDTTRLAVYRLVQESLTNIGKYAAASHVRVILMERAGHCVVAVLDDGIGFDVAELRWASHGLAGMRHRVEACGGHVRVKSAAGRGTQVVAVLPLACAVAKPDDEAAIQPQGRVAPAKEALYYL